MQFHLLDNAVDSLSFALSHYNSFLDKSSDLSLSISEYFSELKFSVFAFHHAIELFAKQILYDVNELLIFNVDVTDQFVSRLLYEKYINNKKKSHLDYWIAGKIETCYKTIDYGNSIKILKSIFEKELSKEDSDSLAKLAVYRNALSHFGFWSDYEWYKIIIVINDILLLIKDFFCPINKKIKEYVNEELLQSMTSIHSKSENELLTIWTALNEAPLTTFFDSLAKTLAVNTSSFEVEEDAEYGFIKSFQFQKGNIYSQTIFIRFFPKQEMILFLDGNDNLLAIVDLDVFSTDTGSAMELSFNTSSLYFPSKKFHHDTSAYYSIIKKEIFKKATNISHVINTFLKQT